MSRCAQWIVAGVVALATATSAGAAGPRRVKRFVAAIERELGLTDAATDLQRGLVVAERETQGLQQTADVLQYAGREGLRRVDAYGRRADARSAQLRRRARALHRLAHGGLLRLAFDGVEDQDAARGRARRVRQSRTLRRLIHADLEELSVHRRAQLRAKAELQAAISDLQALSAVQMVHAVQTRTMTQAKEHLMPQLRKARRARRESAGGGNVAARRLMTELRGKQSELRGQQRQTRAGRGALIRPVEGRLVGRFGTYRDPVLGIGMSRHGVEFAARAGAKVRAPAAGKVVLVGDVPGFERVVVIDHGDHQMGLVGRLGQLTVAQGDVVTAGATLGTVAAKSVDDGLGTTVYLELRHADRPVDPAPYLRGSGSLH